MFATNIGTVQRINFMRFYGGEMRKGVLEHNFIKCVNQTSHCFSRIVMNMNTDLSRDIKQSGLKPLK